MGEIAAMKADPDYQALVGAETQRDQARAEVNRLREALKTIAGLPSAERVGEGRDQFYRLNGHKRAVEIAREALAGD